MVQGARGAGFPGETLQTVWIAGERSEKYLNGDVTMKPRIERAVHLARAAGTER